MLKLEQLQGMIRPENEHMVRTTLVCLENTHNRWGGRIQPQAEVQRVCQWAQQNGLKRHLDGARLWNAAIASGVSEQELAAPFDSISVCFSKGLGAPVGSALVGSKDFVNQARRARKLFGGAMRQAGIIAAGALHAIEHHRDRLHEDHCRAQALGEACRRCAALSIRGGQIDTNIVIVEIDPDWGTAHRLQSELQQAGVDSLTFGPQAVRFITHLDVSESDVARAGDIIGRIAGQRSAVSV